MFFAERWHWPPSIVDEQPLPFLRYAPTVVAAMDAIHRDEQEREMRKQKARAAADDENGPRFPGGR